MKKKHTPKPLEQTARIKKELLALVEHLRGDVPKMEDVSAKALFEVSAEVLLGLHQAFEDYEKKDEPAWHSNNFDH